MNLYLILGYDFFPHEVQAESVIEAIIEHAKYCGDYNELLDVAMRNATSESMGIKMFNYFSSYTITQIYAIKEKFVEVEE